MEQYPPSPHSCCSLQVSTSTLHFLTHAAGIYLNPTFSYPYGFRFDVEVMDGFFTCVERMVSFEQEHEDISKEMEVYRMGGGTFGFNMAIKNRTTKMPGKLQFVSNFQVQNFNVFFYVSHFSFNLQMLGGQAMVPEYPISKSLPFECSTKHAVPLGVSATKVYLTKYTSKSATCKKISN